MKQLKWLCCVLLLSSCAAEVDDPSGTDAERLPPEGISSTSQKLVSGERPLLVVLLTAPDGTVLAHNQEWYRRRIFGGGGERNVRDYFSALSRGAFTYSEAGVYAVRDNQSLGSVAGIVSGDDENTKTRKRARFLAAQAGFDFAAYDTNRDGRVTTSELTLLAIDRYTAASGQTGTPACTTLSGVQVCSAVSLAGHQSQMMNYAHELAHTISGSIKDLYTWNSNCNSSNATLMSCTAGQPFDSTRAMFMDPYHRQRMEWLGPNMTADSNYGYKYIVSAVGNPWWENEVLKVQAPTWGSNQWESLTFELRGLWSQYDDQTPVGLYAWYTRTDTSGNVIQVPGLVNSNPDWAHFVLAPTTNDCSLLPNDTRSRGIVRPLRSGEYVWWHDRGHTTFRIEAVLFNDATYYYEISWDTGINTARQCGQTAPAATVRVFEHSNFQGASQLFGEGNIDVERLTTVGNDRISSLIVSSGAVATLCEHSHAGGNCQHFTGSVSYVGDVMNDKASWVQLARIH